MKSIILVACAFAAIAAALPVEKNEKEPPKIISAEFQHQPDGGYISKFETSDGVVREETGEVKEAFDEDKKAHKVVVVRGSYSYPDPEGHPQIINYSADETGYHAEGEAIPKAPVARR